MKVPLHRPLLLPVLYQGLIWKHTDKKYASYLNRKFFNVKNCNMESLNYPIRSSECKIQLLSLGQSDFRQKLELWRTLHTVCPGGGSGGATHGQTDWQTTRPAWEHTPMLGGRGRLKHYRLELINWSDWTEHNCDHDTVENQNNPMLS